MNHKVTVLTAPALQNSSCSHARYAAHQSLIAILSALKFGDVLEATIIVCLTTGILCANVLLVVVINSRRYAQFIHPQPRYLLTSLACNDLAMGLLVTPLAIIPSLRNCWPYSELICQIQALLRGALSQQSAVILICMAMDRYMCMLHPTRYQKHSSKKGCVAIICVTWILSVTLFAILVLPRGGYYFNPTGMMSCEPFYPRSSLRILVACCFYFPTTMILMYCYGSAFHVNKLRLKRPSHRLSVAATQQDLLVATTLNNKICHEHRLTIITSRTMAAMSLGFIVLVTPWSIQEVVAACTGTRAPAALDFLATWLALSNGFWNPFLYWLLNSHFRHVSREILFSKLYCSCYAEPQDVTTMKSHGPCCNEGSLSPTLSDDATIASVHMIPPLPPSVSRTDIDRISEKYWGEILERTLSSNSLQHAMHYHTLPKYNTITSKSMDVDDKSAHQINHQISRQISHGHQIAPQVGHVGSSGIVFGGAGSAFDAYDAYNHELSVFNNRNSVPDL